jgi:hypothetical protein
MHTIYQHTRITLPKAPEKHRYFQYDAKGVPVEIEESPTKVIHFPAGRYIRTRGGASPTVKKELKMLIFCVLAMAFLAALARLFPQTP